MTCVLYLNSHSPICILNCKTHLYMTIHKNKCVWHHLCLQTAKKIIWTMDFYFIVLLFFVLFLFKAGLILSQCCCCMKNSLYYSFNSLLLCDKLENSFVYCNSKPQQIKQAPITMK